MLPFLRLIISGGVLSFATACITTEEYQESKAQRLADPALAAMYAARPDERFPLPALDVSDVDPQFLRQEVSFSTTEPTGTLVVAPEERFLYLVREGGKAIRYGVGVGRAGYEFQGSASIGRIAEWPRWTPTPTMIAENPEKNGPWAGGMDPGLTNPLGARALYLYSDGRDTLYRIHGTNEPQSIGQSVSSGCIRLFNQDVIDLATRVPVGTRVVVLAAQAPSASSNVATGYGQSVTMTD